MRGIMKEFMLFTRSEVDYLDKMSPEDQQKHIEQFAAYIGDLIRQGKLKSAQPLDSVGKIVSGRTGLVKDGPFNETKEVIGGYFHILAADLDEAVQIAMANPLVRNGEGEIEVRPIRKLEGIN